MNACIAFRLKRKRSPGKIPDEPVRRTYVRRDNNHARPRCAAIDILAAINTCRAPRPRVSSRILAVFITSGRRALNRDVLYERANEKRRAVTEKRRDENYAPPRTSRRAENPMDGARDRTL